MSNAPVSLRVGLGKGSAVGLTQAEESQARPDSGEAIGPKWGRAKAGRFH
jgi:hypothetical protein